MSKTEPCALAEARSMCFQSFHVSFTYFLCIVELFDRCYSCHLVVRVNTSNRRWSRLAHCYLSVRVCGTRSLPDCCVSSVDSRIRPFRSAPCSCLRRRCRPYRRPTPLAPAHNSPRPSAPTPTGATGADAAGMGMARHRAAVSARDHSRHCRPAQRGPQQQPQPAALHSGRPPPPPPPLLLRASRRGAWARAVRRACRAT